MWSTPSSLATSTVRSVEPSSMISHSTTSKPVDLAREGAEGDRELVLLVEARDLDDQLHVTTSWVLTPITVTASSRLAPITATRRRPRLSSIQDTTAVVIMGMRARA